MPALSAEVSRVLELLERCPDGRRRAGLAVEFVPLDENLQPCGFSQTAVIREAPKQCIGLLAEAPVGAKYLRLGLPDAQQTTAIFEVLCCQQFGCFFEITASVLAGCPRSCAGRQETQRDRPRGIRPGVRHIREGLPASAIEAI